MKENKCHDHDLFQEYYCEIRWNLVLIFSFHVEPFKGHVWQPRKCGKMKREDSIMKTNKSSQIICTSNGDIEREQRKDSFPQMINSGVELPS